MMTSIATKNNLAETREMATEVGMLVQGEAGKNPVKGNKLNTAVGISYTNIKLWENIASFRWSNIYIVYGKNLFFGQKYLTFFFDLFRRIIDGNTKKTYQMD